MNYNETDSELFDLYLSGKMPEPEKLAFEKKLQDNKEFAEAFALHQFLTEGIKDHSRAALKAHLKENAKMQYWGNNFWPRSMRFAAAAALIVFIGLYAVIKFYISPEKKAEMAVKQDTQTWESDKTATDTQFTTELAASGNKEYSEELSTPEPPPPTVSETKDQDQLIEELTMDDVATKADAEIAEEDSYYKVLSDRKLMDSTYFAPVLAVQGKLANVYTYSNNDAATNKADTKAKKSKLPAARNNTSNESVKISGKDAELDSTEKALTKTGAIARAGRVLSIEFWTSPVNFKGYSGSDDHYKIYGLDPKTCSFYIYNEKIFIRSGALVYRLDPCRESCSFIQENDQDIINYIKSQH